MTNQEILASSMQTLLYDALNFISETVEEICLKFPAQPDKTFLGPRSTKLSGYASKMHVLKYYKGFQGTSFQFKLMLFQFFSCY